MNDKTLTPEQSNQLDDIIKRVIAQQKEKATTTKPGIVVPPTPPKSVVPPTDVQIPIEQLSVLSAPKMTTKDASELLSTINSGIEKMVETNKSKIESVQYNNLVNERAAKEPLPSIVGDALTPTGDVEVNTSVGKVTVRKVMMADNIIFKLTKSPIYLAQMGDIEEDKLIIALLDGDYMMDIIYQFTHSAKDVHTDLIQNGYDSYHSKALALSFIYTQPDGEALVRAILGLNKTANDAKVSFEVSNDEDKKK